MTEDEAIASLRVLLRSGGNLLIENNGGEKAVEVVEARKFRWKRCLMLMREETMKREESTDE